MLDASESSLLRRVVDLCDRVERDFGPRVAPFAQGIGAWANSTTVGVEIPLGGRIGPMWGLHVRYARRCGFLGLWGPREQIRPLDEVERELRLAIEGWLTEQEEKRRLEATR